MRTVSDSRPRSRLWLAASLVALLSLVRRGLRGRRRRGDPGRSLGAGRDRLWRRRTGRLGGDARAGDHRGARRAGDHRGSGTSRD